MQIIIQTAGESTEESDALELIKMYWKKAGVDLFTKPSQREVFRNRVYAGAAVMSVWTGLENALVTSEMTPAELAPTMQTQLQWPRWGEYYETVGASGQAPDMAVVQELLDLNTAWRDAESVRGSRSNLAPDARDPRRSGVLHWHGQRCAAAGRHHHRAQERAPERASITGTRAPISASTSRTASGSPKTRRQTTQ